MGIMPSLKNTGVTTLAIKAAGLAGLAAVGWDVAHHANKSGAMMEKRHKTDSLSMNYINNMRSDSLSVVKSAVKKRLFAFEADENISGVFTHIKGFIAGMGNMLLDDAIPLGLALGAVVSPRGMLSKAFGLGLLGYGGMFIAQEFFGIGKSR